MTNEEVLEIGVQAGMNPAIMLLHGNFKLLKKFAKLVAEKALETNDDPVAWGMETDGLIYDVICPDEHEREEGEYTIPLYTHPKEWVGLTEEEVKEICLANRPYVSDMVVVLEARLKEKNGYT
jgi:hypothetical protein